MTGLALTGSSTTPALGGRQPFVRLATVRDQPERLNLTATWPSYEANRPLAASPRLPHLGSTTVNNPGGPEIIVCHPPLVHLMRRRYTPESLVHLHNALRSAGIVDVPLTQANLVPAGTASEVTASFGYGAAWWRDTALIALAFRDQRTVQLARGLAANTLTVNQTHRFLTGISHGKAVANPGDMPQIKVSADGSDLKTPWGHNQLDALGLGLFTMATAASMERPEASTTDLVHASALVAAYLARIDFTTVPCNGHWEESGPKGEGAILTSSLGCIVHGLKALDRWLETDSSRSGALDAYLRELDGTTTGLGETLRTVDDDGRLLFSFERGDHYRAIGKGVATLRERHVDGDWVETFADALGRRRGSDLALSTFALLELAAPESDRVLSRSELIGLVGQLERDLKGPIGYRRYAGDGWLAAYPGADGSDPEARAAIGLHIADRHLMFPETSPEWHLGNGAMAHLNGRLYIETRDVRFRDKANEHVNRLVGNIAVNKHDPQRLAVDELSMLARDGDAFRYVGNGLDLNWARAYTQLGVQTMRDVIVEDSRPR